MTATGRFALVAIYTALRWANLIWLLPLGLAGFYAVVISRFEFFLWPVLQVAGVTGARAVRNDGKLVLAILLLVALVAVNLGILNSGMLA